MKSLEIRIARLEQLRIKDKEAVDVFAKKFMMDDGDEDDPKVKNWAKSHHINSSKDGTFSSYSLFLLVIFHLQTCVPAILPPLRDIYPRNDAGDLKDSYYDKVLELESKT